MIWQIFDVLLIVKHWIQIEADLGQSSRACSGIPDQIFHRFNANYFKSCVNSVELNFLLVNTAFWQNFELQFEGFTTLKIRENIGQDVFVTLFFCFSARKTGPKSFLPCATPVARRLMATDLVAEMEEDENLEAISEFQNLMWKTFSVSPLFGYDKVSSPDYIQICLRQHLENQKYNEITVETVKGFAIQHSRFEF